MSAFFENVKDGEIDRDEMCPEIYAKFKKCRAQDLLIIEVAKEFDK